MKRREAVSKYFDTASLTFYWSRKRYNFEGND